MISSYHSISQRFIHNDGSSMSSVEDQVRELPKTVALIDDEKMCPKKERWEKDSHRKHAKRRSKAFYRKCDSRWRLSMKHYRSRDERNVFRKNASDYLAKCAMLEKYEEKMENTIENLFELYDVSKEVCHNLDPFARLSDKEMHYALKMAA